MGIHSVSIRIITFMCTDIVGLGKVYLFPRATRSDSRSAYSDTSDVVDESTLEKIKNAMKELHTLKEALVSTTSGIF